MKTHLNIIFGFIVLSLNIHVKAANILPPLIRVTAEGDVKIETEEAVVTVGVELRHKSLEQVRKETDSRSAAIIDYLKSHGVEEKDIQTSYTSLQPNYPYVDFSSLNAEEEIDNTQPNYFVAQKTIKFVINDLNNYDNVMEGLYDVGINRVDDISFRVSDVKTHRVEARKKAIQKAKKIANLLAKEFGVTLGGLYSIGQISNEQEPILFEKQEVFLGMGMAFGGDFDISGPTIAGGEVKVSERVNLKFFIDQ